MLSTRNFVTSVVVAGAAVGAITAASVAVVSATAPTSYVILADPGSTGGGGPDGQGGGGGCGSGPGWNGCGGWNPFQGGTVNACSNGVCGGWDGQRGWGHF